jgi:predicted transcriptional regulator
MARVTSVRLDDDLAARLDQLAASLDRPRAWLIEQAITRYVEEESWQVAAVEEAFAEYQAGRARLSPHEEVMNQMDEKLRAGSVGNAGPLA